MGSPPLRLFGRRRSIHQILGGGLVADVVLWRRRDAAVGILVGAVAVWVVFHVSAYTLLSLVSNVLLLFFSVLFVWAKAAAILNRPPPPIRELQLSKDVVNEAASFVCSNVNSALSASYRIALGKDTRLFYRVAACLWLISLLGALTDFVTLAYMSIVVVLTAPVLYEKYEDYVDKFLVMACTDLQHGYKSYAKSLNKFKKWILEEKKAS